MSEALVEVGRGAPPEEVEAPENVSGLVRLAIEKNVPVEVLERLVALQERVSERNAQASYIAALSAFQAECPSLKKTETARIMKNGVLSHTYTFTPLDEVARAIRPFLEKHGFSYSWDSKADGPMVHVTCRLQHVEGHAETASFSCPWETSAAMSGAQKYAAALTFGRRQSLVQVLGLTTTDNDTDGAAQSEGTEYLTDSQLADLEALIRDVGADRPRFLKFLRVDRLADLTSDRYADAVQTLEKKRKATA